ncbi:hypothetical protein PPL19_04875 [Pseudomonas psychrotolerans L19]|nr:hypothetical protein PPL19_04875 [Pseudomonas psychrotolerans L19]
MDGGEAWLLVVQVSRVTSLAPLPAEWVPKKALFPTKSGRLEPPSLVFEQSHLKKFYVMQ